VKKRIKVNTPVPNAQELKDTTTNIFINTLIFVLAGIIIVMGWSIYEKMNSTDQAASTEKSEQKPSEIIQVEVLNGCGVSGVGDTFTDFLRSSKIDVVNTDNYVSFDVDETIVIDRIGNMANARKVAELLGIKPDRAVNQLNSDYFVDVTIIIGKDYFSLTPLN